MDIKDKHIDQYTKTLIEDAGLETVSPVVLDNIMKIISVNNATKFSYEPLISKKGWLGILIAILVLFIVLYLFPFVDKYYITEWDLLSKFSHIDMVPSFSIPHGAIYLLPFVVIIFIQIFYIKDVINHKLQF